MMRQVLAVTRISGGTVGYSRPLSADLGISDVRTWVAGAIDLPAGSPKMGVHPEIRGEWVYCTCSGANGFAIHGSEVWSASS